MQFTTRYENCAMMVNEYLLAVMAQYLFLFSDYVWDPDAKYQFGWIFIGLIGFAVAFNLTLVAHMIKDNICTFVMKKMTKPAVKKVKADILHKVIVNKLRMNIKGRKPIIDEES